MLRESGLRGKLRCDEIGLESDRERVGCQSGKGEVAEADHHEIGDLWEWRDDLAAGPLAT